MATDSERIDRLEQLVTAMVNAMPAKAAASLAKACDILHVTNEQATAVRKLLESWVPLEPTEGGEFDPMDYLAANRGRNPLEIEEFMEVGIGDKRYKIHRVR